MHELEFLSPVEYTEDTGYAGKKVSFQYLIQKVSAYAESENAAMNNVVVMVPFLLLRQWNYSTQMDLYKILFSFVKDFLHGKIRHGNLQQNETLELSLLPPGKKPPNPGHIQDFVGVKIRLK